MKEICLQATFALFMHEWYMWINKIEMYSMVVSINFKPWWGGGGGGV